MKKLRNKNHVIQYQTHYCRHQIKNVRPVFFFYPTIVLALFSKDVRILILNLV